MAVVRFDAQIKVPYSSITNSYTTAGSALTQNWRLLRIVNNTDGELQISLNGSTDNIFVQAGGNIIYDLATNAANVKVTDNFLMQINSQFYVKYEVAPTSGNLYIEGVYARNS